MIAQRQHEDFHLNFIRQNLERRVSSNPHFSLRAFARTLGVQPSALSQILSGKRRLSLKLSERILERLDASELMREKFLKSVAAEKIRIGLKRIPPQLRRMGAERVSGRETFPLLKMVDQDEFRAISEWYHYAILELSTLRSFKDDPRWIASQLGISPVEAKLACARLLALGYLIRTPKGLKLRNRSTMTLDLHKTTKSHRKRQKQILGLSIEAIEDTPLTRRVHTSVTLAIKSTQIPEFRERIQKIIWELSRELQEDEPDQVYELQLSLFPLQKPIDGEKYEK